MKFIEASMFGGPEVLTLVETPTPSPTEGTLLVEITAAGVNYADIVARSGFYSQVPKVPFPVGFEIAGVVKGVGKGVEGFKVGLSPLRQPTLSWTLPCDALSVEFEEGTTNGTK